MVTMAKGGLPFLLFNLRKMLSHRITVLAVTAVLAFYVLWQAGSLVWKLWLLNNESPQVAALVSSSTGNSESESLQNLLRYPLIQSEAQRAAKEAASRDRPKTTLNLQLVGLMYSTDRNQARAIIVSEKDGARSYAIHERVADKAEIYSIEPDRVILLHAGRQEALLLDPDEQAVGAPAGDAGQGISDANRNQASSQNSASSSRTLDDLMGDFSATPVMERGQLVGFRLKAVRNPEIMSAWGIDPDDVITAVDGRPLNSQGRVMLLYNKLKKQGEFEVTLNNGGESRTVLVEIDG